LNSLLHQIVIGAGLVGLSVVLQAGFTVGGLAVLDRLDNRKKRFAHHHAIGLIVFFVLLMFTAIVADVWMWAVFFYWSGALKDFEECLYFSTATFTTLGYGDVVLARDWRLLGAFEAANGLLIFGWATAFVIAAIQHFYVWSEHNR
jgi:hypothetical protein